MEKKYIISCTALKKNNMNDITRLTLLLLITLQSEDAEAKFNFFLLNSKTLVVLTVEFIKVYLDFYSSKRNWA